MAETNNSLTIKFDKETKLPLIEGLGKSAYAIAVSHGFKGTEQEWLDSLRGPQGPEGVPGPPGPKGEPFEYTNFTAEQLAALKGERGKKGDAFTYADFTAAQLEALRGPKGDPLRFEDLTESQKQQLKGPKGDSISGAAAVKSYDVIWGIARAGERGNGRGYLEYSPLSGFGKLHLDIVLTQNSGNGGVIATLPANAPVPSRLLEVAVDANNNSVYIEPNSRNIKAWGVPSGKRYIFDIVGFWREI